jgi:hypothetical protein
VLLSLPTAYPADSLLIVTSIISFDGCEARHSWYEGTLQFLP